eukprot:m.279491 g.279491  ORF g.279491 m.279491 type:complete len:129 (+) comp16323_c11_seq2:33-419(+)
MMNTGSIVCFLALRVLGLDGIFFLYNIKNCNFHSVKCPRICFRKAPLTCELCDDGDGYVKPLTCELCVMMISFAFLKIAKGFQQQQQVGENSKRGCCKYYQSIEYAADDRYTRHCFVSQFCFASRGVS